MTRSEFLAKIIPLAKEDMLKSNILASLTIAQACLESGWGNSGLTIDANNLFGMKGAYNGQFTLRTTKEYYDGQWVTTQAYFRAYPSWLESINDHSGLFNRKDRYKNLRGLYDYTLACKYIQEDGYATDPNYTQLLINIIEQYQLYKYDKEVLQYMENLDTLKVKIQNLEDAVLKVYNKVDEMPDWMRPDIQELIDKGKLKGDTDGNLNLAIQDARILVILNRTLKE